MPVVFLLPLARPFPLPLALPRALPLARLLPLARPFVVDRPLPLPPARPLPFERLRPFERPLPFDPSVPPWERSSVFGLFVPPAEAGFVALAGGASWAFSTRVSDGAAIAGYVIAFPSFSAFSRVV